MYELFEGWKILYININDNTLKRSKNDYSLKRNKNICLSAISNLV